MNKKITSLIVLLAISSTGGGRAQVSITSHLSSLQKLQNKNITELNTLKSKQDKNKKAQVALSVVSAISGAAALGMGLTAALNKNLTVSQKKGLIAGAVVAGSVAAGTGIGAGVVTHNKNKIGKEIDEKTNLISKIDSDIAKTKENMKDEYFGDMFSGKFLEEKDKIIDEFNKKIQNSNKKEEVIGNQKIITYTDKKDGTVRRMVIDLNEDGSKKSISLYENNKTFSEAFGNTLTGSYNIRHENNLSGRYTTVSAKNDGNRVHNPIPDGYFTVYDPVKQKEQIVHLNLLPDGVTIDDRGTEGKILKVSNPDQVYDKNGNIKLKPDPRLESRIDIDNSTNYGSDTSTKVLSINKGITANYGNGKERHYYKGDGHEGVFYSSGQRDEKTKSVSNYNEFDDYDGICNGQPWKFKKEKVYMKNSWVIADKKPDWVIKECGE